MKAFLVHFTGQARSQGGRHEVIGIAEGLIGLVCPSYHSKLHHKNWVREYLYI